ncbi:MAG: YfhO family protein [Chitinophagaceae bacterium]|nr:YfhO family protein [Chitinophagaceae bacterium]MCW5929136.1 YfhO family protein [Chitinophagaceae bacterium]
MKKDLLKAIIPHAIAIGIFLVVALIYCAPTLKGKVLQQSDTIYWRGMAQSSFEYKEVYGHFPLWNTHLFSGMPGYQVAMEYHQFLPNLHKVMTLWLPKPIDFFFLACLSFYILSCVVGARPVLGILGSLAFAYASYDPIIIATGHDTKMWTIAYMPGLLAGLLLLYHRKYFLGLAVTTIFATWEIAFNHVQITYYFFIAAFFISLGYAIKWIREKEWKHLVISFSLALAGGLIAVANSAVGMLSTSEYAKYTMRGGKTIETEGGEITKVETKGLDTDYAFSYSIGKSEILTFFMPGVFGEGSGNHFDEDSKLVEMLVGRNIPESQAIQLAESLPKYWGGIQEGTGGTIYLGAIICFLAIVGLVVIKDPIKWWILAACVITIFMAWGRNFAGFNEFLLNNLPLYNKFRSPNTALVIPQLLFPLLAVLGLQQVLFTEKGKELLKASWKKILYATGAVFLVTLLIYLFNDFTSPFDARIIQAYTNPQDGSSEVARMIVNGMKADRKAMFTSDLFRAFLFAALVIGLLYLYLKNLVKPLTAVVIFTIVNAVDLLVIAHKYLNADNYMESAEDLKAAYFTPSAADQQILQDKDPHYRVYNISTGETFSGSAAVTSYHHRNIGGYHPAKLRIYQDLIETQLSKQQPNMDVLNMLDTRYFILPAQQRQQPPVVYKNDDALGAAWFIRNIRYVDGPVEEIKALDQFGPKDTVIIDQSFKPVAGDSPDWDSTASIQLVSYNNDTIRYSSQTATPQFAVFSEIYYPAGWNAYIDGQKTDYVKVNYVLRGMPVPAGKHDIEFRFEPDSYRNGQKLVYVGNTLFLLVLAGGIFSIYKNRKTT